MSFLVAFSSAYVSFMLLLSFASILAISFSQLNKIIKRFSFGTELQMHYFLLVAVILIALLMPFVESDASFEPVARLWAANSRADFKVREVGGVAVSQPVLALAFADDWSVSAISAASTLFGLLALLTGLAIFRHWRNTRSLSKILDTGIPFRSIGRVQLISLDNISTPFSLWTPRRSVIAVPSWMHMHPDSIRISILHEIQHHRQGDTIWAHICFALRSVALPTPFVHIWMSVLSGVQEFACDEALIGQRNVSPKDYSSCLMKVADFALSQREELGCTPRAFLADGRNELKRRLDEMKNFSKSRARHLGRSVSIGVGILFATGVVGAANLAHGWVEDRRITHEQASGLQIPGLIDSDFRIVINDHVLSELNRYLGTPEGRRFVEKAIARKKTYESVVRTAIARYGVPETFDAIPFVESGYRNLPQNPERQRWGAGLWMFIKETARKYGLRVDAIEDQRLDVELETDAAMRLLVANRARFGSWELSLLAYNVGEQDVQRAIDQTGSRNVWDLIEAGVANDHNYVARVMAAALILSNQNRLGVGK